MIFGRLLTWAAEDVSDVANVVRVFTGLGVGGVMAGGFFWLLLHILKQQGANYRNELKIVRAERAQDIERMERQIDYLYRALHIKPPQPPDEDAT